MATVKTLKAARPTVDSATNNVVNWNVEVTFTDGDFTRDYSYTKDITTGGKPVEQYTKDELLSFAPAVLDEVFAHHKMVSSPDYIPPTVSKEVTFDKSGHAKVVVHDATVVVSPEPPQVVTNTPAQ
jgi:hypothetical protein